MADAEAVLNRADWDGAKVAQWVNDPLFNRILEELKASIVQGMVETPTDNPSMLHDFRLLLSAHTRWEQTLLHYMNTGALARKKLSPPPPKKLRWLDRFNFAGQYDEPTT